MVQNAGGRLRVREGGGGRDHRPGGAGAERRSRLQHRRRGEPVVSPMSEANHEAVSVGGQGGWGGLRRCGRLPLRAGVEARPPAAAGGGAGWPRRRRRVAAVLCGRRRRRWRTARRLRRRHRLCQRRRPWSGVTGRRRRQLGPGWPPVAAGSGRVDSLRRHPRRHPVHRLHCRSHRERRLPGRWRRRPPRSEGPHRTWGTTRCRRRLVSALCRSSARRGLTRRRRRGLTAGRQMWNAGGC